MTGGHTRYLTPQEVADLLGVTAQTVRAHCLAGRLPGRRRGRYWTIDSHALDRLIAAGDIEVPTAEAS